jgi:hypothetical protein
MVRAPIKTQIHRPQILASPQKRVIRRTLKRGQTQQTQIRGIQMLHTCSKAPHDAAKDSRLQVDDLLGWRDVGDVARVSDGVDVARVGGCEEFLHAGEGGVGGEGREDGEVEFGAGEGGAFGGETVGGDVDSIDEVGGDGAVEFVGEGVHCGWWLI